jgi:hypothetical protein
MSLSSAVSSVVSSECACCAANTLKIVKLKKINHICIGCLALLAIGGFSLSTYFAYKLWKLKKTLTNLELKIESLSSQLDLNEEFFDDSDEELEIADEAEEESEEEEGSEAEITDDLPSSPGSPSNLNDNKINSQTKAIAIVSRTRPKSPESPDDLNYETPNSSPGRRSFENSYEEKYLRNGFVKIVQKLEQLDDNKCLDAILNETYETLKSLSTEKQASYESVNYIYCFFSYFFLKN